MSKRIPELKVIFDQLLVWFDELVSVYRINLGLPKKIRDAQPNLDVSSLEEKSEDENSFHKGIPYINFSFFNGK